MITSKTWWKAAGIRALKTFCQTAIACIGTAVVITEVNWVSVASASVLAALLSLLTSLAGLPELEPYEHEVNLLETFDFENEPDDVAEVEEIG